MALTGHHRNKHKQTNYRKATNIEKTKENKNVFQIWNFTIFWIDKNILNF